MRLFVAIPLEAVEQARFGALARELGRRMERGKPTRPRNLHLTLHFLGETDAPDRARRAMETVRFPAFALHFDRLGRFARDGGDIVWAGAEPHPALERLHIDLGRALIDEGFVLEARRFRPHLTLARRARVGPCDFTALEREFLPVDLAVHRICLMQSLFEADGVRYRELGEHPAD